MTCTLCPRRCGIDRAERPGYCGSGDRLHIARAKLHFWEEPPISGSRGSGTVFFTGCSLKCAFCQNSVISQEDTHGREFSTEEFIALMQGLENEGAHNINLVTPTHFAAQIAAALKIYKPKVPVVWNCGGYESVETLKMLEGLVDIYLPDFKYADNDLAVRVSNAPQYKETVLLAISEMVRQTGENEYTPDGLLKKGVIIRHLILPAHTRNSMAVLDLIAENFPGVPVSLMSQYTPMGRVLTDGRFKDIDRRITVREHRKVQEYMLALEFPGFCQKRSAAGERYIPDFTQFDPIYSEREVAVLTNCTDLTLYSAMEKILPAGEPLKTLSVLRGEETAFQTLLPAGDWHVEVRTDAPVQTAVYRVGKVPCTLTAYPDRHDADYITTESAELPDILYPVNGDLHLTEETALWVSVKVNEDAAGGVYPVEISANGQSAVVMLTVYAVDLPEQKLVVTQWFHVDCIADLYHVKIYSEAHWALIEKFMRCAADHGQTMILTPVFTPALDTAVGTERPCVQLVEIEKTENGYAFDFAKLRRWIRMARACGLKQFEISHFFSQWGAECTPNIYVTENGERTLRFGWHVAATDPAYREMLEALVPQLLTVFAEEGVEKKDMMFHVSDEPHGDHLEHYREVKGIVEPLLPGCILRDALSDFNFYQQGVVEHPVVASNRIEPFLEAEVPGLWAYYCCGQCVDVSNRFLAMPNNRTRIMGVQMWKHNIEGFLQWGYNFWYKQLSKGVIDPFKVADAGALPDGTCGFPAGDAFSVYPGENGPLCSMRQKVFAMGLYDLRALQLLESRIGYEKTLEFLGEGEDMTFAQYPRYAEYLPALRERVNKKLAELYLL